MLNKARLSDFSAFRIVGPDARAYLNAQLTADLEVLPDPDGWNPAAWCDPKGRALVVCLVHTAADTVELIVPRSQEPLTDRLLNTYRIGRRLEIHPSWCVVGARSGQPEQTGELAIIREENDPCADAPVSIAWERRWRVSEIKAAMPWLSEAVSGAFLPQMLGLEDLGALSFRKGCFPGQEVIARVHHLGRVSRRLRGFELSEPTGEAKAGVPIEAIDGAKIGTVLYSAIGEKNLCVGLCIVDAEVQSAAQIRVNGLLGRLVEPETLC